MNLINDENIDISNISLNTQNSVRKSVRFDIPIEKNIISPDSTSNLEKQNQINPEKLTCEHPTFILISDYFKGENELKKESLALKNYINNIFYKAGLTSNDYISIENFNNDINLQEIIPSKDGFQSIIEINNKKIDLSEVNNSLLQLKLKELTNNQKKLKYINETIIYELNIIKSSIYHGEILSKKIQLKDRQLKVDLDWQSQFLDLIFSIHIPWLIFSIKILFNYEILPQKIEKFDQSKLNDEEINLLKYKESIKKFVKIHFFNFNPKSNQNSKFISSIDTNNNFILNFFSLVYFLDKIKINKILNYNKLFVITSSIKSTSQLFNLFITTFLKNQQVNLLKRLSNSYSFSLTFKQSLLNEYNFFIQNIYQDMRDGVKLIKLLEILTNGKLSEENENGEKEYVDIENSIIRLPSINSTSKVHNLNNFFQLLKTNEIFSKYELSFYFNSLNEISSNKAFTSNNSSKLIAGGNISKTSSILYSMIYTFEFNLMVNNNEIIREIQSINKEILYYHTQYCQMLNNSRSSKHIKYQTVYNLSNRNIFNSFFYNMDNNLSSEELLLLWCQTISLHVYRYTKWSNYSNFADFYIENEKKNQDFNISDFNSISSSILDSNISDSNKNSSIPNSLNLVKNYMDSPELVMSTLSDGRIFCLLIHYYFPSVFPSDFINELIKDSIKLNKSLNFENSKNNDEEYYEIKQRNFKQLNAALKKLNFISFDFIQLILNTPNKNKDDNYIEEKIIMLFLSSVFLRIRKYAFLTRSVIKVQRAFQRNIKNIKTKNELKKINNMINSVIKNLDNNSFSNFGFTSNNNKFSIKKDNSNSFSNFISKIPKKSSNSSKISNNIENNYYSKSILFSNSNHTSSTIKEELQDISRENEFNIFNGVYFDCDNSILNEELISSPINLDSSTECKSINENGKMDEMDQLQCLEKRLEELKLNSNISDKIDTHILPLNTSLNEENTFKNENKNDFINPSFSFPKSKLSKRPILKNKMKKIYNNKNSSLKSESLFTNPFETKSKIPRTPIRKIRQKQVNEDDDSEDGLDNSILDSTINMEEFRIDSITFDLNNLSTFNEYNEDRINDINDYTLLEDSYHDTISNPLEADSSISLNNLEIISNTHDYSSEPSPFSYSYISSFLLNFDEIDIKKIKLIQSICRQYIVRKKYLRMKKSSILISRIFRGYIVRKRLEKEIFNYLIKINSNKLKSKIFNIKNSLNDHFKSFVLLKSDYSSLIRILFNFLSLLQSSDKLSFQLTSPPYNLHIELFLLLKKFLKNDTNALKNKKLIEAFVFIFYFFSKNSYIACNISLSIADITDTYSYFQSTESSFIIMEETNEEIDPATICCFTFIDLLKFYRDEFDIFVGISEILKNFLSSSPQLRYYLSQSKNYFQILNNLSNILEFKIKSAHQRYQDILDKSFNINISEEVLEEIDSAKKDINLIEYSKNNIQCIINMAQ